MHRKEIFPLFAILIILVCIFLYKGTIRNHILDWDDQFYLRDNPYIKELSISNLKQIFTRPYFKNYNPVHLLSYLLDHILWGGNYTGYHLTNLCIHIINGILILILIYIWTKDWWLAFFLLAIFLVHPIQVETVAWLSERKGLLAGLFFLASLLSFNRLKITGKRQWYIFSFITYFLGILSKPMAITLPLILILQDLIIYQSMTPIIDLIPFFFISFFSLGTTIWAQSIGGGIKTYLGGNLLSSIWATPYIILRYLARIFWPFPPFRLSSRYVIWPERFMPGLSLTALGPMIVVLCLLSALLVLLFYKKERHGIFGLTWFFILLLPVLNLVPTSTQMADRYLYLPAVGLYLLAGVWIARGIRKMHTIFLSPKFLYLGFLIPIIWIAVFGFQTRKRVRIWQSDKTLWEDALKEEPRNYYALAYLGNFYFKEALKERDNEQGRAKLNEAEYLFRHTLDVEPFFAQAHVGLASIYIQMGKSQDALPLLKQALKSNTEPLLTVRIYYDLGLAFMQSDQLKEAEFWFKRAIKEDKTFKPAYFGLGQVYTSVAEREGPKDIGYQKAAMVYQKMIQLFPTEFKAYFSLAIIRGKEGRTEEAMKLYNMALSLPGSAYNETDKADAHISLGILYQARMEYENALIHYEAAIKMAPNHPKAGEIEKVIYQIKSAFSRPQMKRLSP